MGKKQHSKDRMYLTATEWQRDFGGHKGNAGAAGGDFPRLELDCCSLSFQPFTHPVCTAQGQIFELENIVPFVTKFRRNPVSNEPLALGELIKLHFARNDAGELMDPVLFKVFSENTHVVAIKPTGNVYSYEAIDELCIKAKSMRDLLTDAPFTKADIITLQDPHNILARNPASFAHIKDEAVAKQVDTLKAGQAAAASASSSAATSSAAAPAAAAAGAPRPAGGRPKLGISLAVKPTGAAAAAAALSSGPARAMYSSGAVSGSFTSTSMSVATNNERSLLSAEQILEQRYADLRKRKAKGYVRLHTTLGNINLELHCDLVPRTCHNYMELCERGYYKDTIFHRVIPGFMVQGGDPDGTGRGGEGAFERTFRDEFHSALSHDSRGVLAMANSGPNTNASQFYLTFDAAPHLNHKHTVFGRVVGGMEVLDAIEKVDTVKAKNEARPKDAPRKDIVITAITVFDNPFRAEFTPVDELTRKKANEAATAAAADPEDAGEKGQWFSNPAAESARPALSGNDTFKYLNLPKADPAAAVKQPSKRKGSPNAATPTDEGMGVANAAAAGAGHPALRAAAPSAAAVTSPGAAMDTAQTPKGSASSAEDDDAAAFEAARKRQMQAKALAAAQKPASSSYGNFGNF